MRLHLRYYMLALFLLLAPSIHAEEKIENFNNYQSLQLHFTITTDVGIVLANPESKLAELKVDLSFFPRENNLQKVETINRFSTPQAEMSSSEKYTSYKWQNIAQSGKVTYGIDAAITTRNVLPSIAQRIPFPIASLDPQYLKYTQASAFIDITPAIEQQAYNILGGENDLYSAVFKIADWTKTNIRYDLTTLTANAVQKSSWVLENKEGVCDELTNLFISMLRSVGIPARFVSGMVYSNTNYRWGPHGWAEVYFPDVGWVPFDVTFGEYGWLDPSHIELKEDADSGSPSAEYSWKSAENDKVQVNDAKLEVALVKTGNEIQQAVNVHVEPYVRAAGPGSYVPLMVTLENTKESYIAPVIVLTKAPGLEGSNVKQVLLKPQETKTVAWLLKIPAEAEASYIYTSNIETETTFGNTATSSIKYATSYEAFGKDKAQSIVNSLDERSQKGSLSTAAFSCAAEKETYYENDDAAITCNVQSVDQQSLDMKACLRDECQQVKLLPRASKQIQFKMKAANSGRFIATVEDSAKVAYAFFNINTIKIPEVSVIDVSPETVKYGDAVHLTFKIHTETPIKKVNIDFGFNQLNFDEIKESREIDITTSPKNLINGLKFELVYQDPLGKVYTSKQAVIVKVTDIPWYARIVFWLARFFQ